MLLLLLSLCYISATVRMTYIEPGLQEVQVVSLEDDSKNMVPISFDQHNSTLVLSMMKGMSYMPGLGLGRRQ